MDKQELWENIKKYAKIAWEYIVYFLSLVWYYLKIFASFVWKHAKRLFKKLRKVTKKHIYKVTKHAQKGDYKPLIYTIIGLVIFIVLFCLLINALFGKKKKKQPPTTTEITTEATTTEAVDPMAVLREQAQYIYQNNPDFLMYVNAQNPVSADYTFEQHTLNSGYIVDERIYPDLLAMLEACNAAGFEYEIKGGYIPATTEGCGEYATGLAFDVTAHDVPALEASVVATLGTNQWLMQNCSAYGFIVRNPEGKEAVTGTGFEPWHFRYVGKDAAGFMTTNNLTLDEFYSLLNGASTNTVSDVPANTDIGVIE